MDEIDVKYLRLKDVATISYKCQVASIIVIFFGYTFFTKSNPVAVICGCLCIGVSLIPLFYSIKNKDFSLMLSCISIYNLAPIWFLYLESVLPGYDAYVYIAPEYRMTALMWISSYQFFVNVIYVHFGTTVRKKSIKFYSFFNSLTFAPSTFIIAGILMFIIPLMAFYVYYGSPGLLWKALTAGRSGGGGSGLIIRNAKGDESSFMLPFVWVWQLTPLIGTIAFIFSRKKFPIFSFICLVLGFLVIFVFFLGGTRSSMMLVAAPSLFFLFYYNWNKGLKFWIVAGLLLVGAIGIMELQVRFRGNLLTVLSDPTAAAKARGLQSATTFDPAESQRDNNMYLLGLMVKSYPSKYKFEGFNDFFAVLVNPVPRAIWPGKPLIGGQKDLSTLRAYIRDGPLDMGTTSLTTSVVGNAYLSYGLLGIIVFTFVYGSFLSWFDGLIYYTDRKKVLVVGIFGIGVFLSFWSFRGFFAFISFLYPILSLTIFLKFTSPKGKRR